MIVIDSFPQGSKEWHAEKLGKPGSSSFSKIFTPVNCEYSKSAERFAFDLAMERISGTSAGGYSNKTMESGLELEPEGVAAYELMYDCEIHSVAVVYPDEKKQYLCSPDGLVVGKKIGFEQKNVEEYTQWQYIKDNTKLVKDYYYQLQGSLLVTGYDEWHIMSRAQPINGKRRLSKVVVVEVKRDETYIQKAKAHIIRFLDEVARVEAELKK